MDWIGRGQLRRPVMNWASRREELEKPEIELEKPEIEVEKPEIKLEKPEAQSSLIAKISQLKRRNTIYIF